MDTARRLRNAAALLALGLGAAGFWQHGRLPPPAQLLPATHAEPEQTATLRPAFDTERGGVRYRVQPVHDYTLTGLVVSQHRTDTWWNWIHKAWGDHLNVADLCVVWGAQARDGAYQRMTFSSGQFVCYVQSQDEAAWQPQYLRALSNNHLLTDEPALARRLRSVRVGDQVRFAGELVAYSHAGGFSRGTSTSRDDTGNGACETVFVRDFAVVRPAPRWPGHALQLAVALGLAALVLHVVAPYRVR